MDRVILAEPVITVVAPTGAETNTAVWPGIAADNAPAAEDSSEPTPGSDEIAAGTPPGGLIAACGSPANLTDVRGVIRPAADGRPG